MTYDINKIKETLSLYEKGNDEGKELFLQELKNVPASFYENIFFPYKKRWKIYIVTDIKPKDNTLCYIIRPIGEKGTEETRYFGQEKALDIELMKNIAGAIEVTEISQKQALLKEREIIRRKEIIEESEIRKNL